jgi:hypothetical protein
MNSFTLPRRRFLGAAAATMTLGAGLFARPVVAANVPKVTPPVLVTSLGQSLDAFQVQLTVRRMGVAYEYDPLAGLDMLADKKTLFLAVGASKKGFGDAGITINDELARTTAMIDAAEKRNIFVTVLHVGGEERRDALSDQLIDLAAPRAKFLIIREDSDADGKFAGIAKAKNIPLVVIENVNALRPILQEMFVVG